MTSVSLSSDEEIEFFKGFVERYSPSENEGEARDYLLEELPEMGFEVETDSVGNVIASVGNTEDESSDEILLTSHMDTVPGEIPVSIEGGKMYGRGTVDAKGPLSSMILGAARHAETDTDRRITVAAVVEEEKSGRGARYLSQNREEPDFLINGEPSGWDTVTLGYRGILRLRYRVTGEVIHTARPGVNAIEDVIDFWNAVKTVADDEDGFRSLQAKPTNIESDSDGFELRSELRGNIRIPPSHSVDELKSEVREHVGDGDLYFGESTEPVMADRSNPVVRAFTRSIRDEDGDMGLSVKTGTSDMNVFAESWDCPMVTYGPGDSNLDHTPDEHIEIAEFRNAVDVIENAVDNLA
ncbi:MAG: [LysW]-lysine hydrolase [Halobacteria archaeon]|nr:[LysW]-lysine hydrolase [Halobacteria archaeon]